MLIPLKNPATFARGLIHPAFRATLGLGKTKAEE